MVELSEDDRKVLKKLVSEYGSMLRLSKEFDVAHTTLDAWISGKTKSVHQRVYDKLIDLAATLYILKEHKNLLRYSIPERSKVNKTERIETTAQPLSAKGVIIAAINGELEGLSLGELREVLRNILNMKRGNEIRKEVKYGNDDSQRGSRTSANRM